MFQPPAELIFKQLIQAFAGHIEVKLRQQSHSLLASSLLTTTPQTESRQTGAQGRKCDPEGEKRVDV